MRSKYLQEHLEGHKKGNDDYGDINNPSSQKGRKIGEVIDSAIRTNASKTLILSGITLYLRNKCLQNFVNICD